MKEYKIKTNGRNKEILTKAKELGYDISKIEDVDNPTYLYLYENGDVRFGEMKRVFHNDTRPEISVDDFLKLGEKPDAYVQGGCGDNYKVFGVHREDGKSISFQCQAWALYKYNIISEEEYKAKYPDKLQLKGHDVEFISDNFVKIGTVTFHRYILEMLFHNMNTSGNDPCEFNNITLEDLFHFISDNKEEFGL